MSANLNESVTLVTTDPNRTTFGTGFAVYKDFTSTYIVTCAHVIEQVSEGKPVIVGEDYAEVVVIGSADGPDDLAVLRVNKHLDIPVLSLADIGTRGQSFIIAGYQAASNQYIVRPLRGRLGDQLRLQARIRNANVKGWDIEVVGSYTLEPGYSGSPVVDEATGDVVAVISHRGRDGKKGLAISIASVYDLWTGRPTEFAIHKEQPKSTEVLAEPNLPQRIDLKRQPAPRPPQRLIEELEAKNLIPIIGAGLSISVRVSGINNPPMPNYQELLERLIERIGGTVAQQQQYRVDSMRSALAAGDTKWVAQNLTDFGPLLFRELRAILNPIDEGMLPSPAHNLLRTLDFSHLITTNYDRLLERFVAPTHEVITPLDEQSLLFFDESVSGTIGGKYILKLHGDITRPETIFFGTSRLEELYRGKRKEWASVLKGIFRRKTALFIGFSFQTESEGYAELLEEIFKGSNRTHYALIPRGSSGRDWQARITRQMGIQFLEYYPDNYHSQVWEFISYLNTGKQDEPLTGRKWAQWYLPNQRSEYLDRQLKFEQKARSVWFLTPSLTNAIATNDYLNQNLNPSMYSDPKVLPKMFERRDNLLTGLRGGNLEVRVLFLQSELESDLRLSNPVVLDRYVALLDLIRDPEIDLEVRLIPNLTVDDLKREEATYALIFSGSPTPLVDVAIAYASQATKDYFQIHMVEVNTDRVKDTCFQFERLWSSAWSEQKTEQYIETLVRH